MNLAAYELAYRDIVLHVKQHCYDMQRLLCNNPTTT